MGHLVGYRFHPTDEELINYYLKNKILGNTWLVDAINEININNYEPECLPSLVKIPTNDPTWYFFAPTLYVNPKKTARKRSIKDVSGNVIGFWKITSNDREIKDKNGNKIGEKKTLVYRLGKHPDGEKTPWVMHEYLIKCWSHPDPESYVLCKIKYKVDGTNSSVPVSNAAGEMIGTSAGVEEPIVEENGPYVNDSEMQMNEQVDMFLREEFYRLFDINNYLNEEEQTANLAQDDNDDEFLSGLEHVDRDAAGRFLSDTKAKGKSGNYELECGCLPNRELESFVKMSGRLTGGGGGFDPNNYETRLRNQFKPVKQEVKEDLAKTEKKKTHKSSLCRKINTFFGCKWW